MLGEHDRRPSDALEDGVRVEVDAWPGHHHLEQRAERRVELLHREIGVDLGAVAGKARIEAARRLGSGRGFAGNDDDRGDRQSERREGAQAPRESHDRVPPSQCPQPRDRRRCGAWDTTGVGA